MKIFLCIIMLPLLVLLSEPAMAQKPLPAKEGSPGVADTLKNPLRTSKGNLQQTAVTPSQGRKGSAIVDDSTKMIYGPKTTRWTTEKEIFEQRANYRPLDTALSNFHRWTYFSKFNYMYQDLGNNGTALNPIFPTVDSETIGVSPGFRAFGYYYNTQEPVFYNSKSPYTRMQIVWGGKGRAMTRAEYTRNINPRWNFGFNYRPIFTTKQVQKRGKSDYQVVSHYYDFYTHFLSKDSSYSVLASYRRMRHRVNENGGVVPLAPPGVNADSLTFEKAYQNYFRTNAGPVLKSASSFEQRNQLHILQQYTIAKGFQAYHMGDLARQMNYYRDDISAEAPDYYDNREADTLGVKIVDSTRFSYLQNQVGFKGRIGKKEKLFVNAYYRIKSYNLFYKYLNVDSLALSRHSDEHYAGGQVRYSIDSAQDVFFHAELLEGGYQRLVTEGQTKWLDWSIQKLIAKPSFLPTAYRGHFDYWSNEIKPIESQSARIFPKVQVGPLFISPGISYTGIDNYFYFLKRDTFPGTTQRILPRQATKKVEWVTPEIRLDLRLPGNVHIRPQLLYTKVLSDADSALKMPTLFFNGQIAVERHLFNKNLEVQIGFDFHWHSAYKANGYDPVIQTFYVQNEVVMPSYLLADFFFNGKLKRGRFFIKWHNLLQQFQPLIGHMPTPYYRGMRNVVDFGFDILMFD